MATINRLTTKSLKEMVLKRMEEVFLSADAGEKNIINPILHLQAGAEVEFSIKFYNGKDGVSGAKVSHAEITKMGHGQSYGVSVGFLVSKIRNSEYEWGMLGRCGYATIDFVASLGLSGRHPSSCFIKSFSFVESEEVLV